MNIPRAAAAGFALGLAWGAAARVWMRLISTDPEFSWSGTGFILGSTALCGLTFGVLYGVRSAGRSRWWRLLALVCVVDLAGPGMVFIPALLLGGLLWFGRLWSRSAGVLGIAGGVLLFWWISRQDPSGAGLVTTYGGFLLLSLAVSIAAAELYRPSPAVRILP
ncbi:hypothetical protein GCM10009745_28390 [Kribbella yunnanensis]|uniref:Uncharacterized protein n=1 Tax=Kribbella yunnanensis TaxID=190194 RepID=A0ABN2H6N3_9ACTN